VPPLGGSGGAPFGRAVLAPLRGAPWGREIVMGASPQTPVESEHLFPFCNHKRGILVPPEPALRLITVRSSSCRGRPVLRVPDSPPLGARRHRQQPQPDALHGRGARGVGARPGRTGNAGRRPVRVAAAAGVAGLAPAWTRGTAPAPPQTATQRRRDTGRRSSQCTTPRTPCQGQGESCGPLTRRTVRGGA